jgi:hypothetical protein
MSFHLRVEIQFLLRITSTQRELATLASFLKDDAWGAAEELEPLANLLLKDTATAEVRVSSAIHVISSWLKSSNTHPLPRTNMFRPHA